MVEDEGGMQHYNLLYIDENGNETAHGTRQPAYGRPTRNPPLQVGGRINLPFGVAGEGFRGSGYWFVIQAIRNDGGRHKALVLRPEAT